MEQGSEGVITTLTDAEGVKRALKTPQYPDVERYTVDIDVGRFASLDLSDGLMPVVDVKESKKGELSLVMPLGDCDLFTYLSQKPENPITYKWANHVAGQLAKGCGILKRRGIIHLDIKSANIILFDEKAEDEPVHSAVITDFGWSTYNPWYFRDPVIPGHQQMYTSGNIPPELFLVKSHINNPKSHRAKNASFESDVFALGMTFVQLFCRPNSEVMDICGACDDEQVFQNKIEKHMRSKSHRVHLISSGLRFTDEECGGKARKDEIVRVLSEMLCWSPAQRLTIEEVQKCFSPKQPIGDLGTPVTWTPLALLHPLVRAVAEFSNTPVMPLCAQLSAIDLAVRCTRFPHIVSSSSVSKVAVAIVGATREAFKIPIDPWSIPGHSIYVVIAQEPGLHPFITDFESLGKDRVSELLKMLRWDPKPLGSKFGDHWPLELYYSQCSDESLQDEVKI